MLAFEERGKPEYTEENLSVQNREPTNSTHNMTPNLVIEPGPHWWEASALTTTPFLKIFLLVQDFLGKKRYFSSAHLR